MSSSPVYAAQKTLIGKEITFGSCYFFYFQQKTWDTDNLGRWDCSGMLGLCQLFLVQLLSGLGSALTQVTVKDSSSFAVVFQLDKCQKAWPWVTQQKYLNCCYDSLSDIAFFFSWKHLISHSLQICSHWLESLRLRAEVFLLASRACTHQHLFSCFSVSPHPPVVHNGSYFSWEPYILLQHGDRLTPHPKLSWDFLPLLFPIVQWNKYCGC